MVPRPLLDPFGPEKGTRWKKSGFRPTTAPPDLPNGSSNHLIRLSGVGFMVGMTVVAAARCDAAAGSSLGIKHDDPHRNRHLIPRRSPTRPSAVAAPEAEAGEPALASTGWRRQRANPRSRASGSSILEAAGSATTDEGPQSCDPRQASAVVGAATLLADSSLPERSRRAKAFAMHTPTKGSRVGIRREHGFVIGLSELCRRGTVLIGLI